MIERPKCMKANEVAEWIGISKTTWVRSNIAGKTPRGLRLGRLVLWDRAELERWLEAGMPARVIWEANNKRTKKEIAK
jgi:excisionase family DNA binding protein